jgi:hypothetical protein
MRTNGFVAGTAIVLALALSACGGGNSGGDGGYGGGPSSPPPPAPTGNLQLQSSTLRVAESAWRANVLVTRNDGTRGAVGVTLTTSAGSASANADFTTTSTTVTFADGDAATKTVAIPVLDDGSDEPDESFTVALSAATGGATLGTVTSATITIVDDDDADILTHRVAGTVSGLSGAVALRNNNADEQRVEANGAFTFAVQIAEGQRYEVTIATQPAGQDCTVAHASGTMGTSDVIDVAVTCTGGTPPPPPQPTTGVFTGGPVRGLHYRTPSHSGLTDEAGAFIYIPGEHVAFSVGSIELGSALGAPQINLFTLFGMTPPTTELALRTEINSPNNITDFDRVANRAHLLFALDVDHDAANGIDLGNWNAQLADATLDLEMPMRRFSFFEPEAFGSGESLAQLFHGFAQFARGRGIEYKFPPEMPLVHLYRSLGLTVSAHATNLVTLNDSATRTTSEFDAEGRLVREVNAGDEDGDGDVDYLYTLTLSYDVAGHQISVTGGGDENTDGVPDWSGSTTYAYDAAGNLVTEIQEQDNNGDGSPESRTTITNIFDRAGVRDESVSEEFVNQSTIPRRRIRTTTYHDAAGNKLTQEVYVDDHANGTIDRRTRTDSAYAYNAAGLVLSEMLKIFNATTGTVFERKQYSFSYDDSGNMATYAYSDDIDGDNVIDYTAKQTLVRDAVGNTSSSNYEYDYHGAIDYGSRRLTTTTYDSAGNRLSYQYDDDDNADGAVDAVSIARATYGVDGNPESFVYVSDGNSYGNAFGSTVLTDGLGYLLRSGDPLQSGLD